VNWLSEGLTRAHEILLRQPRIVYIGAIVVTLAAITYSLRLIFTTPLGPPVIWIVDILVLALFWISHVRYRVQHGYRAK
jgi:uncharacterized membrane protein